MVRGTRPSPGASADRRQVISWQRPVRKSDRNSPALRKLYFHFLSNWMGYDHGDSFPFAFLNQIEFHLVQNRKEICHQSIPSEVAYLSVHRYQYC